MNVVFDILTILMNIYYLVTFTQLSTGSELSTTATNQVTMGTETQGKFVRQLPFLTLHIIIFEWAKCSSR